MNPVRLPFRVKESYPGFPRAIELFLGGLLGLPIGEGIAWAITRSEYYEFCFFISLGFLLLAFLIAFALFPPPLEHDDPRDGQ